MLIYVIFLFVIVNTVLSGFLIGMLSAHTVVMRKLFNELEVIVRQKINGFLEVFRKSKGV